jgi:hypothetical protein
MILFQVTGMKPNTRVYAYFNDVAVSSYCAQVTPYSGSVTAGVNGPTQYLDANSNPLILKTTYDNTGAPVNSYFNFTPATNTIGGGGPSIQLGTNMTTDSSGAISGVFFIPPNTFKAGDIVFKLLDISNLAQGTSAISTQSTSTYVGSGLSVSYGRSILNTQQAKLVQTEVTNTQVVQTSGYIPGPIITIVTPSVPPYWFWSDIRLKRDVELMSRMSSGINLYKFKYLWSDEEYVGVMAQEVMNIVPDAVRLSDNGYYMVNYDVIGMKMISHRESAA